LPNRGEGQPKTMSSSFLIACAAVAAVIALLIGASVFGVSRRALEAEIRLTDEDVGESTGDRDEAGMAA
jgi:hypothetical protein